MSDERANGLIHTNSLNNEKLQDKKIPGCFIAYSIHILLLMQEKALESLIASLASGLGIWAQNCLMNEICTCMNFISHISY